jgi:hypothetical protein
MFLAMRHNSNLLSTSHRMNHISITASVGSIMAGLLLARQASTGKFVSAPHTTIQCCHAYQEPEPFPRTEKCFLLWPGIPCYDVQPSECASYLGVSANLPIMVSHLIALVLLESSPFSPPCGSAMLKPVISFRVHL